MSGVQEVIWDVGGSEAGRITYFCMEVGMLIDT
jgi:hypothetical protein